MPRGGKRTGAGRPAGSRDSATVEQKVTLQELARQHTDLAIGVYVKVATEGESESARVAAASAILDRGYGKPSQAMELTGADGGPIETMELGPVETARRIAFALARGQNSKPADSAKD